MKNLKLQYYNVLDKRALELAEKFKNNLDVTFDVLTLIYRLYESTKVVEIFNEDDFSLAYNPPITSDFEFLIARIFHHYSKICNLNWVIFLRRQKGIKGKETQNIDELQDKAKKIKTKLVAPDIRIEKNGAAIALIEIKARTSYAKSFFSKLIYEKAIDPKNNQHDILNQKCRDQINKYLKCFKCKPSDFYYIVPSLFGSHGKTSTETLKQHLDFFKKESGLPRNNFVLLSNNMNLDLSNLKQELNENELQPTSLLEDMMKKLASKK